jgi:hypothetical protein
MPIATGARLDPYEIVAPLGSGGMSARGHAARRAACGIGVSSRWRWGPTATESKWTDLAHAGGLAWR